MANEQTVTRTTKTPDPGVKLPEAVVRAAARAAELSEQQKTRSAAGNTAQMSFVDINSPLPPIAPTPTPAPAAPTPTKTYSESEFRAMVGRFEKAQQDNQNLIKRVNEMQRLLATVGSVDPRTTGAGRGDVTFTPPTAPRKYITPKDEQEWSAEFIDVARRAAKEVVEDEVASIRGEVTQVRQSLGSVQQNIVMDAQQNVWSELNKEVPDWATQNEDSGFKNWLGQIDPLSGMQRQTLLMDAFNNGQASRVVAAFKGYKAELAASGPAQTGRSSSGNGAESPGGQNATDSRSNPATTPTIDLTSLAAPGRARSGQVQSSPDKPIITGAEIAQFYSDVTRGRYADPEGKRPYSAEYYQIEAQIQDAMREGRVRR